MLKRSVIVASAQYRHVRSLSLITESQVRDCLRPLREPLSQQPLLTNVAISVAKISINDHIGNVGITLHAAMAGYTYSKDLVQKCEQAVSALPWVRSVSVEVVSSPPISKLQLAATGLAQVQNIVAVSSCKGGVG